MTGATVQARLLVTGKPTELTKKDGARVCYAPASEPDDTRTAKWRLFGMAQPGDLVTVRGPLVASCEGGIAIIAVNVQQVIQQNSTPAPTPEAKCADRGTRLATREGVEAADRDWRERTAANQ
jgi:hypothetical protein